MKILLDTHTFIWYVTDDARLSSVALEVINNGNNEVLLSIASIWEMSIKYSIGKLNFESSFELFIPRQLADNNNAIDSFGSTDRSGNTIVVNSPEQVEGFRNGRFNFKSSAKVLKL